MKIATLLLCFSNAVCFQLKTGCPRKYQSELFATLERRREFIQLEGPQPLLSRRVEVTPDLVLTVWEWEEPAEVVESYWEAEQNQLGAVRGASKLLDPFGIVSWPGSLVASRELIVNRDRVAAGKDVVILGAGVGLEAQAAALSGASHVLATDIHPTTLRQLKLGVEKEDAIYDKSIVETRILDLFAHDEQPLPDCDLLVVADVLYNESLAIQVVRRIVEAWNRNQGVRVLVTDSQRFVPTFDKQLNELMEAVGGPVSNWTEEKMTFTGSGVCMNEDQTYDVTVRKMWIGI